MTFQMHRFIECMGVDGRLRSTRGHLGCRPLKYEPTFCVKGTVYSSKQTSFARGIKFNMRHADICFIEARCVVASK